MENDNKYYDQKWLKIIPHMPQGADYRFDLRQYGHDIIKNEIPKGSKVFDYACGLGVICKQLQEEKDCIVSGFDYSKVAIEYCKENINKNFTLNENCMINNKYDFILAIQFLEHIKNPCQWIDKCFKYTDVIICALPNNFRHVGEHIDMQWSNWDEFNKLFKDYTITRLDDNKYPDRLNRAFRHPIIKFTKGNKNARIDDRTITEKGNKADIKGNEETENEKTVKKVPTKRRTKRTTS